MATNDQIINSFNATIAAIADDMAQRPVRASFSSRVALVLAWSALSGKLPVGDVISDGSRKYVKSGLTDISDLPGLSPFGIATPWHYPVVGDGVTDDGEAIQALYANNRTIYVPKGRFRISNRTIAVTHPTTTDGDGDFVFTEMGGFAGKDGFDVQVGLSAPLLSVTSFEGVGIFTDGAFGRDGIKTPVNQDGNGLLYYQTVRPKFVFKNLRIGSLKRTATVSSSTVGIDGWLNPFHVGESADSVFENIEFIQPFNPTVAVATWGGREEVSGVFLDAGVRVEGNGPIYHPIMKHLSGFGCGALLRTKGFVAVPRMSDCDATLCGYGIKSIGSFAGALGRDCISELNTGNSNLNGVLGAIHMEATDWLDVANVRTSVPVVTDVVSDWCALTITSGFLQVNVDGFRAAQFGSTGATRKYKMFDLNGRVPGSAGQPGMVSLTALNILSEVPSAQWNQPIALRNVRSARVSCPQLRLDSGSMDAMLYIESDHVTIPPRVHIDGFLPTGFADYAVFGTGGAAEQLFIMDPKLEGSVPSTGLFQKFESGLMIAHFSIPSMGAPDTALGNVFASAELPFSFPPGCVFSGLPTCSAHPRGNGGVWGNARPTSTTAGTLRIYGATQSATALTVDVQIIGKWR